VPRRRNLDVGDRVGPYQLCVPIGAGGMARVFLATADGRVGRHRYVAVKCLRDELAVDPAYTDMFLDEVRVTSQIAHPNVCRTFDAGFKGHTPYMVMDFFAGRTVREMHRRIAARPELIPVERRVGLVARLMAEACEGVHAIHEARDLCGDRLEAVHRDICPNNLLVTYDGQVVVLDLGVARSARQRHVTRSGVVKGKYAYLAPELLEGGAPDRRSDIWSLGVVCWELLTAERLFHADTDIEILRAIDGGREIAQPSRIAPGLSDLADEVVMCALERDPDRRLDDIRELGELFTQLMIEVGDPVGLAEVAGAMDEIFPGGRDSVRALYDRAESVDAPLVTAADLGAELDPTGLSEPSIEIVVEPACERPTRSLFRRSLEIAASALTFGLVSAQ
jgi:serine/threonine-protein kinase